MLGWIAEKIGEVVVGVVISDASQSYSNTKAYQKLRTLLETAHEKKPSQCRKDEVTRLCPQYAGIPNMYDKRAGGTSNLHIYNLVAYDGKRIHLQFFDTTQKIFYWTYDANWNPLDSGQELNPVEALAAVQKATGYGVTPVSPH